MNYNFSYKLRDLKPQSDVANNKDIIDFSQEVPSKEVLPENEFQKISGEIFSENELSFSNIQDYEPLKTFIKGILFQKGVFDSNDNILLTSGLSNALELLTRTLTDFGDTVICEEPCSDSVLNIFKMNGLKVIGVPLNSDGMDTDRLETAMIKYPNARFIYVTPNFQNPSGITTSAEKRNEIYSIAHKYNTLIIENDIYGDLRYSGADEPSEKSLDKDGRVIYVSSFSKILAPSINVGYICADSVLISKVLSVKNACMQMPGIISQMSVKRFFDEFDYFEYTRMLSDYYRTKCELMLENLKFELPTSISFTEPEGGFYILGTLENGADVERFCNLMLDKKVKLAKGTRFTVSDKRVTNSFRLNFSYPTDEEIKEGINILGKTLKHV